MYDPVISALVTEKYKSLRGVLKGYKRRVLIERVYPGVVKDPSEEVDGVLYFDVNEQDVKTLDEFEFEYTRDPVEVIGSDGKKYEAGVYVIRNAARMS